jgi:hypothetical protein
MLGAKLERRQWSSHMHQRADELLANRATNRATNVMTRVVKQHMRGKLEAKYGGPMTKKATEKLGEASPWQVQNALHWLGSITLARRVNSTAASMISNHFSSCIVSFMRILS